MTVVAGQSFARNDQGPHIVIPTEAMRSIAQWRNPDYAFIRPQKSSFVQSDEIMPFAYSYMTGAISSQPADI